MSGERRCRALSVSELRCITRADGLLWAGGRVYAQGDLLRFITLNALLAWRAAQIGPPLRCSRYSPGVMPVHVLKLRWKERASVKPR